MASGRFDRRVPVELPDLKGREEILKVHAKKVALAPGIDFNTVARMASGASGAELANIVNEAALRAVRAGRKSVTQADLEESIEVVIAGYQKKNSILTDKEKCIVAYHEIGHALVAAKQSNSAPVQKITIIPRTSGALGYTMQVDEGNHYLMSKEELAELLQEKRTTIFYEAPHKLRTTLDDLANAFGADRSITLCRELTKLHEDIWKTTLGEAVEHYKTNEPRGEYVLVMAGAPETADPEQELTLEQAAQRALELTGQGFGPTAAAKAAAQGTPYSKSEVYKQLLVLQQGQQAGE